MGRTWPAALFPVRRGVVAVGIAMAVANPVLAEHAAAAGWIFGVDVRSDGKAGSISPATETDRGGFPDSLLSVRLHPVPGDWRESTDLARMPDGSAAVVMSGRHRIALVSANGQDIRTVGGYGARPGEFSTPVSIDVSRSGRAVVSDPGNARIQVFDSRWIPIAQWTLGPDPSRLSGVSDPFADAGPSMRAAYAAWGDDDEVLAFDPRAVRLIRLSGGGGVLQDISLFGELPRGLTGMQWAGSRLHLLDPSSAAVHELNADGAVLGFRMCPAGTTAFHAGPSGITCAATAGWSRLDRTGAPVWQTRFALPPDGAGSAGGYGEPVAIELDRGGSGWLLTRSGLYRVEALSDPASQGEIPYE